MILPEEPEPPDEYRVKKEWFSRKLKMYVVRKRSDNLFITAMESKPLALDWIDRHNQRRRRRE